MYFIYFLISYLVFTIFFTNLKFNFFGISIFLLISISVSVSNQSYYFDAREESFKSNIIANDKAYSVSNVFEDRAQLYTDSNNITKYRDLDFDGNLFIKEFNLCCPNLGSIHSKGKPIGYLELYKNFVIYITGTGEMFYFNLEELMNNSMPSMNRIQTNFNQLVKNQYLYGIDSRFKLAGAESIRSIFYDNEFIYVSFINESYDDCVNLSIVKGKLDFQTIDFTQFFSTETCIPRTNDSYHSVRSGGVIENYDTDNLIFTTGDFGQVELPQNLESEYGKTLKINKNDASFEILSYGHRNSQGIKKFDTDLFLSTEHGPRMGDEINIISTQALNNYGWPMSSYGVHYNSNYGINYSFEVIPDAPLYKSHKDFGFIEPIYYFGFDKALEHGISDIEIINSESDNLQFIFGSLAYGRLYIASYDTNMKKFNSLSSYNVNNRIRDIVKVDSKTFVGLFENPPKISIISLPDNK